MSVPTSRSNKRLRMRYGANLQQAREALGLTQLDVAVALEYGYSTTVSQIERGKSALPEHDLYTWALVLRQDPAKFAKAYLYFLHPNVFRCLYGVSPYDLEGLPQSEKTIRPPQWKAIPPDLTGEAGR
jgi:transcriptional regulator with XRE-family HTH domain